MVIIDIQTFGQAELGIQCRPRSDRSDRQILNSKQCRPGSYCSQRNKSDPGPHCLGVSDLGLHCLLFCLHLFEALLYGKIQSVITVEQMFILSEILSENYKSDNAGVLELQRGLNVNSK